MCLKTFFQRTNLSTQVFREITNTCTYLRYQRTGTMSSQPKNCSATSYLIRQKGNSQKGKNSSLINIINKWTRNLSSLILYLIFR
jgi:hypothetical protein